MTRDVARTELLLDDEWTDPFAVWQGHTLTVLVSAAPANVQVSSTQPPNPPRWNNDPIELPPGEFSRARPFGYVRFKNANRGDPSRVVWWAYAG